jgi:hypothetical protein
MRFMWMRAEEYRKKVHSSTPSIVGVGLVEAGIRTSTKGEGGDSPKQVACLAKRFGMAILNKARER